MNLWCNQCITIIVPSVYLTVEAMAHLVWWSTMIYDDLLLNDVEMDQKFLNLKIADWMLNVA